MKKIGLVVGRFQPLHNGHQYLIEMAVEENDEVVVVIGSVGKVDSDKNMLHTDERYKRMNSFLEKFENKNKITRIVLLRDIESDEDWPKYLKENSGITDETKNTFYTGDNDLSSDYLSAMERLGFKIRAISRNCFRYEDPRGIMHKFSCATEIRNLHRKFELEQI